MTGETRALIAQHDPDLPQSHVGQQGLRAVTAGGALGRAPQIRFDHLDALLGPPQVAGMLAHGVLELLAFGVGPHLMAGGLPNVDHRFAAEMMGLRNQGHRHGSPR